MNAVRDEITKQTEHDSADVRVPLKDVIKSLTPAPRCGRTGCANGKIVFVQSANLTWEHFLLAVPVAHDHKHDRFAIPRRQLGCDVVELWRTILQIENRFLLVLQKIYLFDGFDQEFLTVVLFVFQLGLF